MFARNRGLCPSPENHALDAWLVFYQEWGKEAIEMKPGDCINIPPEVKHWHGAAPDAWFSHLAVEVPGKDGSNEWLEAVTDEQYSKLK